MNIKMWLNDLEDTAVKQAENLSNLPFAFHHVAIMPDAHSGYGMPIGGVLATKDVVIPNAVGCFTGDTKIPLLNGTQKTLKELYDDGEPVYVYSIDKDMKNVCGLGHPMRTRENAELLEVVISGGEKVLCTPDHRFMLLNGEYREARNLKIFDSLMPLNRTYQSKDGYEYVHSIRGNGGLTHKIVATQFCGLRPKGSVVHHIDGKWYNNNPDNIEYKLAKAHSAEHRKLNPVFTKESFKEKRLTKLREKGFYSPEFAEKKKSVAIKNIQTYNESNEKKENDKLAGKRGAKYLIEYNESKKNHKVLSVSSVSQRQDVYCLNVETYHNFALSAGVFVHNCDIGCGMVAKRIFSDMPTKDQIKEIMGRIRERIPVGFNSRREAIGWLPDQPVVNGEKAALQLGTLGGGNHFIELQRDADGCFYVMIHSGSRNLGKRVCDLYNAAAKDLNAKWHSSVPAAWDLAFLPVDSDPGRDYLQMMDYCCRYAELNRKLMLNQVVASVKEVLDVQETDLCEWDVAHNYVAQEHHFGENVFVHRKGAVRAREGEVVIIPGSQGSKSYIARGLGNPDSFMSCSHGAGRKMSRSAAKKSLNLEEQIALMDSLGVVHGIRHANDLDEAPGSYKDIDVVMENQKDLVTPFITLTPLGVVKG